MLLALFQVSSQLCIGVKHVVVGDAQVLVLTFGISDLIVLDSNTGEHVATTEGSVT